MKLAKLSLAAIVVAGLATSSFAADTLADAFKNGKVKGDIKARYWDRDNGAKSEDIVMFGAVLGYVTDSFNGFKLGLTFQANSSPFIDDTAKPFYQKNEYGPGAVLSESYLQYSMGKTTAKLGRQFISSPLVAGSGSRVIRQSFEALTFVNTDLPQTTLIAGYVDKFQNRTDGAGNIGEFKQVGTDGAYTIAAINKSIANLTVTAAWAQVVNSSDHYYLEGAYAGKTDSFTYGLAAQYALISFDAAGIKDADAFGLKASMGMGAFSGFVAYATTGKDTNIGSGFGLGGGTDNLFTNNIIGANDGSAYSRDTNSYAARLQYAIAKNARVGAQYLYTDSGVTIAGQDDTTNSIDLFGSYAFEGALKGFSIDVVYEDAEDRAGVNKSELRFNTTYKF
ncbi:MAG: outer membrane porin, OprD family [Sulfurospirillum sp.]|nr:outer membrane porin, OprD family [Sulfurospirillum sp.]